MTGKRGTLWDRFQTKYKVNNKTNCWEWIAALSAKGYGWFFYPPRNMVSAHIASWELHCGSRNGLHVLHECDNPKCVNPQHLYLGTHQDNMCDRDLRGRRAPPKGIKNGRARVTEKEVKAIRADKRMPRFIVRDYPHIPYSTIQKIRYRETWKHI